MREGSYTTETGKVVHYSDADTMSLVSDLYQFVEHEYKGTESIDSARLEVILKDMQAGKPLAPEEWDILADIQKRIGKNFQAWRDDGKDDQGAQVPEGSGRLGDITEAARLLPGDIRRLARESTPYQTDATTPKDRKITPVHLHDGGMHDLAHAIQHGKRLEDPDVANDPAARKFNLDHLMKHLESGIDHFSRSGQHLAQFASDPKVWNKEKQLLHRLREAAPKPPPNLRPAEFDGECCGTCDMFYRGQCWGYGTLAEDQIKPYQVASNEVCDSWVLDPAKAGHNEPDNLNLVHMALAAGRLKKDDADRLGAKSEMVAKSEPNEPTICVDFDGVIHQGPHGLPGAVNGTLVDGAVEGLKKIKDFGFKIVLFTARVDLEAVRDWLKKEKLGNLIDEVTNRKPPASAYIDDRATHFTDWPTAVKAVDPMVAVHEEPTFKESERLQKVIDLPKGILAA